VEGTCGSCRRGKMKAAPKLLHFLSWRALAALPAPPTPPPPQHLVTPPAASTPPPPSRSPRHQPLLYGPVTLQPTSASATSPRYFRNRIAPPPPTPASAPAPNDPRNPAVPQPTSASAPPPRYFRNPTAPPPPTPASAPPAIYHRIRAAPLPPTLASAPPTPPSKLYRATGAGIDRRAKYPVSHASNFVCATAPGQTHRRLPCMGPDLREPHRGNIFVALAGTHLRDAAHHAVAILTVLLHLHGRRSG
jgi:hypothetical protein